MTMEETIKCIRPLDEGAMEAAKDRWDAIAKPLHSLGLLEDAIVKIAGMTGSVRVTLDKRAVIVMCADNGVVAEGVTQTGNEVTGIVAENMTRGETSVCQMARVARAQVIPVDIGVAGTVEGPGLIRAKVSPGTANMARGPAMTRAQAVQAVETGIRVACDCVRSGCRILATGEMGIGNTTTSSALASVFLGRPPEEVTGRGAGLSDAGLSKKVAAIRRAIAVNRPDPADPLDTLSKVGGLDIAGLAGVFLGGAACRVPVLLDGFISGAAALTAARLCPPAAGYMLASHVSKEAAAHWILEELGLSPFLTAQMCLGEGTGAVAALPILDMALAVYGGMSTFADIEMEAYEPLSD
ncbi:nicotinate-nucleotide--dimethylbenzimidazole phosphoribosyltransferase [Zongyangia hominis]|uniref:Nicotinate-nucleotide--dimethylbenzimidazole phosphoribosyltransferase n=2 Tax=Zongyangia hominis TaxID=2763677 RepID=A0A926IAN9_9FIRM|nr:nicotinate-nucleotide--dimethylbenzimidazole phosphoribosyltransferase [Zongyangia hominis]MBC8569297.1 nicotinate-nucleotide--dimethylbenzimidazole phosphoribosyltransferase [Zongyangia hominis]